MKLYPMIVVAILPFIAMSPAAEQTDQPEAERVLGQIAELKKAIIPPEGTEKAKVDSVYGEPKKEVKKGIGASGDYPMHVYDLLLPAAGAQSVRAYLHVTYQDNKVQRAGIKHSYVLEGRVIYCKGSVEDDQQRREIEAEKLRVLKDLKDIQEKFAEKLKEASWTRKSETPPGGADKPR